MTTPMDSDSEIVRQKVREGYAQIAKSEGACGCGVSCCGSSPEVSAQLVRQIGYSAEELAALPEGANMGLSCGNPTALASLKPGEVALDLGAGGGFDVFIAGRKVGPGGRAIGVDMTPEMLSKARRNAGIYRERSGLDNVEFRLGEIEHLPIADASVDVVISNCVINLSPNKAQVWREIARVLKPGGRVAVSDLALLQPLPEAITKMVEALIGCVAGAVLVSETERLAREAGLSDIQLIPKTDYINAMTHWEDPLYRNIVSLLPPGATPADYVTSLEVKATKPGQTDEGADIYTPAMAELVAIGAAIAANCKHSFKRHFEEAHRLGVSLDTVACAVNTAHSIKQTSTQTMLKVADRFLQSDSAAESKEGCCGGHEGDHSGCSCQ